ncbi:MAG: ABC transporter permease [Gammaproteobacteria bacterium]|nr:ABC transporter permease [Gammaproteobacteria bacterium]
MDASLPYLASARHLWRHPWQLGLGVLGIALGVAAVVAIQTTRASVSHAFDAATAALAGGATHQIIAAPPGVDEQLLARLRRAGVAPRSTPIIERTVTTLGDAARTLTVLGIDPFAARGHALAGAMPANLAFLTRQGAYANAATATMLGVAPGDRLMLGFSGGTIALELVAIAADTLPDELLVVDLATAQEAFGLAGHLSRIDLLLDTGADDSAEIERRIRALLPANHWLVAAGTLRATLGRLTEAFHANLGALGLLALLVGLFLVYNAQSFLVRQRRELFGRLRTLGVTRAQLARVVLFEALLFGSGGTALGLALGLVLARRLLRLALQTINDLYFHLQVAELQLSVPVLLGAALLGIGGTVLAAVPAIVEAARASPRQLASRIAGERTAAKVIRRVAMFGALLIAIGSATLWLPSTSMQLGLAALFLLLLGGALLVPPLVHTALGVLQAPLGALCGHAGFQATRAARRNLSRTGVAAAALALAVASGLGIGTMVESFRHAVDAWLGQMLRADLYLSAPGSDDYASGGALDDALLTALASVDGVAGITTVRTLTLTPPGDVLKLTGYELNRRAFDGFQLLAGDRDAIWRRWQREPIALASEPFARKRRLAVGDRINLPARAGTLSVEIAGIYRDYGNGRGTLAIDRALLENAFGPIATSSAGIYLSASADLRAVQRAIEALLPATGLLHLRPQQAIRDASLQVFDRTFLIAGVLRDVATVIAAIGVFAGLLALALERTREFATQRALGQTRAALWWQLMLETGLLGLLAGLCALPLGGLIAIVLIDVVNVRAFGWTMAITIPWPMLGHGLLLALGAALLAGCYPAWRLAAQPPAAALREE